MSGEARTVIDKSLCEADWQRVVEECAAWHGWLAFHDRDSRKNNPGFPDLVLVKQGQGTQVGRLVFFECKTERGRVRPEQRAWLDALVAVPGVIARVVRPSDWNAVEATLRGGGWQRMKGGEQ
jgi:NADH:ubiquinone oxidoreductase subunit